MKIDNIFKKLLLYISCIFLIMGLNYCRGWFCFEPDVFVWANWLQIKLWKKPFAVLFSLCFVLLEKQTQINWFGNLLQPIFDQPNRDDIDFRFLGKVSGQPYILQTNLQWIWQYRGENYVWFAFYPAKDFHTYFGLWNLQHSI